MKPFNLNDALVGHPVVTRDNRPVTQLTFFEGINSKFCVYAVIDGQLFSFTKEGKYDEKEVSCDLFMQPVKTEKYLNLYKTSEIKAGYKLFDTEQEAIDFAIDEYAGYYYKTIKIDWED